ncbi:hypothetical protein FCV63_18975 [Vibrio lentus]|uniref:hypothetical protein n=1 Tax=Vibrio lentus TaxID=136468 RepID=UPI0010BE0A5E|nr:hypothetical protein [Vibrio lentus]TKF53088.1 hypothetical protein FCV63_18975 [Vibrio lentus]
MQQVFLDIAAKVAACVCGRDGLISEAEEKKIYELIKERDKGYSIVRFNNILDEFFESSYQLENYLDQLSSCSDREFIIKLCEVSASADGLDIKENIALKKVKLIISEEL